MGWKQLLVMDHGEEVGLLLEGFRAVIHSLLVDVTQFLINSMFLILYTRKGCCLCEGLEQRLKNISFEKLVPTIELEIIDIDSNSLSENEKNNLELRVPVMVISSEEKKQNIELPRVSPRIHDKELFRWVQKNINNVLGFL